MKTKIKTIKRNLIIYNQWSAAHVLMANPHYWRNSKYCLYLLFIWPWNNPAWWIYAPWRPQRKALFVLHKVTDTPRKTSPLKWSRNIVSTQRDQGEMCVHACTVYSYYWFIHWWYVCMNALDIHIYVHACTGYTYYCFIHWHKTSRDFSNLQYKICKWLKINNMGVSTIICLRHLIIMEISLYESNNKF